MYKYPMHGVQLVGPGLVDKIYNKYENGEYAELENVDLLLNGVLRTRRSILNMYSGVGMRPELIGSVFDGVTTYVYWQNSRYNSAISTVQTTWAANNVDLYVPLGRSSSLNIRAVVGYNFKLYAFSKDTVYEYDRYQPTDVAHLLTTTIIPNLDASTADPSVLVYKDRAFYGKGSRVNYTKATDFTKWDVANDGGYFIIPQDTIIDLVEFQDRLFIFTNRGVYLFGFNNSPGQDGALFKISDEITNGAGCIKDGILYASSLEGLYAYTNGSFSLVIKYPKTTTPTGVSLIEFDDSLIIHRHEKTLVATAGSPSWNFYGTNPANLTVHSYNIKSQSLSYYTFNDLDGSGYIRDIINVPIRYEEGSEKLVISTTDNGYLVSANHIGAVYQITTQRDAASEMHDQIKSNTGNQKCLMKHVILLPNIKPDGLAWTMKKFRHMILEGKFPGSVTTNVDLTFTDTMTYTRMASISTSPGIEDARLPRSYRFNVMQRAKSVGIKIQIDRLYVSTNPTFRAFELMSIMFLYTPLERSANKQIGSTSSAS